MISQTQTLRQPTLASVVWPADGRRQLWRNLLLAVAGTALLTVSARLHIPFWPVPLTLQPLAVLLLGFALGSRLGAATVLLYLVEGAFGLPVFSGTPERGIGLVYMMGTTGGYLIGFVFAATACGLLAERGWDRDGGLTAFAMLIGITLIYLPGLLWLGAVIGWDKPILQLGLYPFVMGDLLKLVVAVLLLPTAWRLVGRK